MRRRAADHRRPIERCDCGQFPHLAPEPPSTYRPVRGETPPAERPAAWLRPPSSSLQPSPPAPLLATSRQRLRRSLPTQGLFGFIGAPTRCHTRSRSLVGETRFARAASWVEIRRSICLSYSPHGQEPRLCSGHLRDVNAVLWLNELVPGWSGFGATLPAPPAWDAGALLNELNPASARLTARLVTRGVFVVVPATKDASRRPRAPRWHATLAGDYRFPRIPGLPGSPSNRDTAESGTLVRQEGDAPSSSTWQADALLLSYCLETMWFTAS